jgi:histidine triad (HIT) family protein
MEECIICKIINDKIPSHKVYEDDETIAMLDIYPSAPGHTMVSLKKHGLTILDYTQEELGKLWSTAQKIDKALISAFDTKLITIGINQFEEGGVPHLHVHLIPRWKDDGGGIIQTTVKNPPKESLDKIKEKITKAIVK